MLEYQNQYWNRYDDKEPNTFEVLIHKIDPIDAVNFIRGCSAVNSIVSMIQPDVIFLPLRGAGPIGWVLDEIEMFAGNGYQKEFLRIGTTTDVRSGSQKGLNATRKREVVDQTIQFIKNSGLNVERAVVIDEVQSGSTLSVISRILVERLRAEFSFQDLHIVALQDNRENIIHRAKVSSYRYLTSNEIIGIKTSVVPMPMFVIDRVSFLDSLLVDSSCQVENQAVAQMIHHNVEARDVMKFLTFLVYFPEEMNSLLRLVTCGEQYELSTEMSYFSDVIFWYQKQIEKFYNTHDVISYDPLTDWLNQAFEVLR